MQSTGFFTILNTVDSTNNYAIAKVHAGMATHGMAWFAREQTHGKGQRSKNWVSEKDQNIILSIVVQPFGLLPTQQFYLSAASVLGTYDFFNKYAMDSTRIKWPNDLYWRDRKAGGILIENIMQGSSWNWAITGIGININQTQFAADINKHAVSLKQITGQSFDVVEMAKEVYSCILQRYELLDHGNFTTILSDYNAHLFKKDEIVVLKKDHYHFPTTIKRVNEHGQLITADAMERVFNWGEVEWVL